MRASPFSIAAPSVYGPGAHMNAPQMARGRPFQAPQLLGIARFSLDPDAAEANPARTRQFSFPQGDPTATIGR